MVKSVSLYVFLSKVEEPIQDVQWRLTALVSERQATPGTPALPQQSWFRNKYCERPIFQVLRLWRLVQALPYHTGPLAQGILVHVFSLVLFSGADLGKAALSSQMPRFIHSVHTEHSEQGGVGMKKTHRLRLRPPSAVGKDTKQSKGNKMLHTGSAGQLVVSVNKTRARTKTLITLFPSAKRQFGGSILVVKE